MHKYISELNALQMKGTSHLIIFLMHASQKIIHNKLMISLRSVQKQLQIMNQKSQKSQINIIKPMIQNLNCDIALVNNYTYPLNTHRLCMCPSLLFYILSHSHM